MLFILSILLIFGCIYWIHSSPGEVEPWIALLGSLIGLVSTSRRLGNKKIPKIKLTVKPDKVTEEELEEVVQSIDLLKVFISYSHDSEQHRSNALRLADRLNLLGIECWIDRYVEDNPPERGWPNWMEEKIRTSDFILVVCSNRYQQRLEGKEEDGIGLGAKFESILLVQQIYGNDSKNKKIIPVFFNKKDREYIPNVLKPYTNYNVTDREQFTKLYKRLTKQPDVSKPAVGKLFDFSKGDRFQSSIKGDTSSNDLSEFFELETFTENMKSGNKIVQAYFRLPVTKRFEMATKLGLLKPGENINASNRDEISSQFLLRAKEKNLLEKLWAFLFANDVDPNPFKNSN